VELFPEIQPRYTDFDEIKPRPITDPAEAIAETAVESKKFLHPLPQDADAVPLGQSRSDVLLKALRIIAAKPPSFTTDCAMRDLIRRHSVECGLGS
jgi:hypothetical protein